MKPSIVIIMTDQQRADLSRREGFALDTTPFLDSLAREGAWFSRAYTSMPACAPARVSMLTGRYPSATRVRTNHNIRDAYFSEDLFDVFRKNGYATGLCGKNHSHLNRSQVDFWHECGHLGIMADDKSPDEAAFDEFLRGTHFHMSKEPTPFSPECQIPYRLVSSAQRWIRSLEDQPFLLWLSFPEPHNPYQVPEPYYSMFSPEAVPPAATDASALETKGFKFEWCRKSFVRAFPDFDETLQRARSNYMGMLRLLDDQARRFVGFLDEMGLRQNTILVVLSDHGDFVGEYGLMRKGPEVPEPLVRIPLQFAGPGIHASESPRGEHVSIVDIMPTLCSAAGIAPPDGVQGRNLWPMLTGQAQSDERFESAYVEQGFGGQHYDEGDTLDPAQDGLAESENGEWGGFDCLNSWTQSGTMRMVRKGDWKLVYDMQGNGQLYNLASDPSELVNLYGSPEHAGICQELIKDLLAWSLAVEDPLPVPRSRYVLKRE